MIGWIRRQTMRTTTLSGLFPGNRAWVAVFYRFWSPMYDLCMKADPAFPANQRRMVEGTVRHGDRVLDVGIGTGMLAEVGAPIASEYHGIDYSQDMLSRAERKIAKLGLDNVHLQQGDARELPFQDDSFDAVVSSFVLPHFARPERPIVLGEMARVLRPGGRLGLFLAQGEVAPLFSLRSELEAFLDSAGFTAVEIIDRDDVFRIVHADTIVGQTRG